MKVWVGEVRYCSVNEVLFTTIDRYTRGSYSDIGRLLRDS